MFLKDAFFKIKQIIGARVWSARFLSVFPRYRIKGVNSQTDLCLAGFPRSGNSFVFRALLMFNPDISVAHHIHLPYLVEAASQRQIPTLFFIRPPQQVLASLLVSDRRLSVDAAIWNYCYYHRKVWPFRDHMLVSDFADHTKRLPEVVHAMNAKFNASFACEKMDQQRQDKVFEVLKQKTAERKRLPNLYAGPSAEKEKLKAEISEKIITHPRFSECMALYQQYLSVSVFSEEELQR
ncbi:MAG: hypothetical protein HQL54_05705 [Magnetococcales bacterium]|nr:hypothetical protein [Magnetococcales bacterium]